MNIIGLVLASLSLAHPSIDRIEKIGGVAAVNRRVEFVVGLAASYKNPFDPEEVSLDLAVTSRSGKTLRIPGFLYRSYRRSVGPGILAIAYASTEALKKGAGLTKKFEKGELLEPTHPEEWRVRFTPTEPGKYRLRFELRDRTGRASKVAPDLDVKRGSIAPGFVGIDPLNPRAFRLSTGQSFFPIGANIGWADVRGTRDYDDWLSGYGKAGANWGRVWLSPSWTTFALEQPGQAGRIALGNAWRLDYALDLASRSGIYLQVCIDSYNVLRDGTSWPEWSRSPFNVANGGPLRTPFDFWHDPEMARQYRNKLRYLVARWGSEPHVFAWEFWNEVDGITDFKAEPVREWCRSMGKYLISIDPYHHLLTSSYGGNGAGAGDAAVFALPQIDFSVSHLYDSPDGPAAVIDAQRRLRALGKPHFVAEFGADASGPRGDEDPHGMQLHDALWSSIASGGSGASMLWWWDSYIHPKNLYPQLGVAASLMKGVDWGRERLEETPVKLEFLDPPKQLARVDVVLEGGVANWSPSPVNRPKTIQIDPRSVRGGPVGGFLHGIRNHPELHNPITFETDLPWPTVFEATVGDVSGYGGANLKVTVDGNVVFDKEFVDTQAVHSVETLKGYAGTHSFEIGIGRHKIVVENSGPDWVRVDYRFKHAILQTAPQLVAWASIGQNLGFAWVRQTDRTWRNVIEKKLAIPAAPPSLLVLPKLRPGTWEAQIWDTWLGKIVSKRTVTVVAGKPAKFALPAIGSDLGVKLIRQH